MQDELTRLSGPVRNGAVGAPAPAGPTIASPGAGLPPPIAAHLPASVPLEDLGRAPEVRGISAWINAGPQTIAALRGKVVLVHFWTFGCFNCRNVQHYVKAWYDRYEAAGFTVIGVHTPELSFERDLANVRQAVADQGVRFPVAFDPDYTTWNDYANRNWPAFYFVDKSGRIRHEHFGEGDYDVRAGHPRTAGGDRTPGLAVRPIRASAASFVGRRSSVRPRPESGPARVPPVSATCTSGER